jgi:hypothetical protein
VAAVKKLQTLLPAMLLSLALPTAGLWADDVPGCPDGFPCPDGICCPNGLEPPPFPPLNQDEEEKIGVLPFLFLADEEEKDPQALLRGIYLADEEEKGLLISPRGVCLSGDDDEEKELPGATLLLADDDPTGEKPLLHGVEEDPKLIVPCPACLLA